MNEELDDVKHMN
jgi:hypothetical protein